MLIEEYQHKGIVNPTVFNYERVKNRPYAQALGYLRPRKAFVTFRRLGKK